HRVLILAEPGDDPAGVATGNAEDHLDPGLLQHARDKRVCRRFLGQHRLDRHRVTLPACRSSAFGSAACPLAGANTTCIREAAGSTSAPSRRLGTTSFSVRRWPPRRRNWRKIKLTHCPCVAKNPASALGLAVLLAQRAPPTIRGRRRAMRL